MRFDTRLTLAQALTFQFLAMLTSFSTIWNTMRQLLKCKLVFAQSAPGNQRGLYKRCAEGGHQHSLLNPSGIMNKVFASVALVVFFAAFLQAQGAGKSLYGQGKASHFSSFSLQTRWRLAAMPATPLVPPPLLPPLSLSTLMTVTMMPTAPPTATVSSGRRGTGRCAGPSWEKDTRACALSELFEPCQLHLH